MKLEKIEIQGFKSFYDYQVMEFRPGVTGIVGPNGCGKSNISDAISWVLGTQSATQLRGKRMDDLIFNGSRTRKPRGLAQAKMRMKSDDGDIPGVDDGVIEIGRRLFRTGESDYLLNGKVCRLRDIQEVTMDTGLGTTAYTVIEQGKVDQILSNKSQDRRELLEEAAGITRFKAKRHQADLKLQATRHNLLRLHDVMREIDKQVRNLARQAGKARKYRRLREEMMDFRLLVYIENYFDIFSRQEEALRRISGMQDHEMKTAVALSSKEAETEDYKIRMIDSEKILSSLKEILFGMEIKLNNLTRSREEHKRRIGESKILIGKNRNRTADLKSKRDERIQSLADEENRCRKIREDVVLQEKELAEKDSGVSEVKNKHSDFEKKWEKINKEHLDLIGHLAQLQALIVKTESELEQENNKYRRNRAEFAELEGELSAVLNKHKDEGDSLKNLSNEIDSIKSDMAVKSGKVKAYREELREKTDEIQQIKENITRLKSEIETMKTMQWADPGKFSAGEYLYELEKEGYEGLDGYLLEKITVSEKYRVGIERYLEDTIKYFIAEDLTKALDISKMVKEEKHGRAAFYVRQLLENMPPHPTLDIDGKEGVVSSLHREVKGRGDFAYFITRLFPDAYIIENINSTPSLLELLKEGDLVSLGGDLLFSKGVFL